MHERKMLVYCVRNDRKKSISDLKAKYEALKEFDKNRPNKGAAIQFNVPRSTLPTRNQPISTIVC